MRRRQHGQHRRLPEHLQERHGVVVGQISTLGKTCTGSAMTNGCSITFVGRLCTEITLRAAADNDGNSSCCGGSSPDSMIVAVSAW